MKVFGYLISVGPILSNVNDTDNAGDGGDDVYFSIVVLKHAFLFIYIYI